MDTPSKLIGCPTCSVSVLRDGSIIHEPNCMAQEHSKFKGALHKVAHILKEVGITAAEVGIEAATSGLGAIQE